MVWLSFLRVLSFLSALFGVLGWVLPLVDSRFWSLLLVVLLSSTFPPVSTPSVTAAVTSLLVLLSVNTPFWISVLATSLPLHRSSVVPVIWFFACLLNSSSGCFLVFQLSCFFWFVFTRLNSLGFSVTFSHRNTAYKHLSRCWCPLVSTDSSGLSRPTGFYPRLSLLILPILRLAVAAMLLYSLQTILWKRVWFTFYFCNSFWKTASILLMNEFTMITSISPIRVQT